MSKEDNSTIHLKPKYFFITLIGIVFVGYYFFNHNQQSQNALITAQQQKLDATDQELQNVKEQVATQKNIDKKVTTDYSGLVSEWSPRVVRIDCMDNAYVSTGSGVLTRMTFPGKNDVATLVTNKHVVTDPVSGYQFTSCAFGVPGITNLETGSEVDINLTMTNEKDLIGQDVAFFPSSSTQVPPGAKNPMKICLADDAVPGDKIIILGYPGSGGTGDATTALTVTSGLISSNDGKYYVTDAKIDHGNSGGAAILVKSDCYLGIPTWVQSGGFESLGRILKASYIFTN